MNYKPSKREYQMSEPQLLTEAQKGILDVLGEVAALVLCDTLPRARVYTLLLNSIDLVGLDFHSRNTNINNVTEHFNSLLNLLNSQLSVGKIKNGSPL